MAQRTAYQYLGWYITYKLIKTGHPKKHPGGNFDFLTVGLLIAAKIIISF